jgi:hypothetical protein
MPNRNFFDLTERPRPLFKTEGQPEAIRVTITYAAGHVLEILLDSYDVAELASVLSRAYDAALNELSLQMRKD